MRTNPIGALYAMVLSKPATNLDHDGISFFLYMVFDDDSCLGPLS